MNSKEIVRKNLELMRGREKGQMEYSLMRESYGGNAGHMPDGRPCAGANLYFGKDNGEIIYFGNEILKCLEEDINNFGQGIFRVALDPETFREEIVGAYYTSVRPSEKISETTHISDATRSVLLASIKAYNMNVFL
ncbi:MAG: hypothetical protein NT129_02095 [Candidatus Aenigmarchaeota archaeon]|nr:hypothetical protein [Candidatus Aenigmarchaeota archaeon]